MATCVAFLLNIGQERRFWMLILFPWCCSQSQHLTKCHTLTFSPLLILEKWWRTLEPCSHGEECSGKVNLWLNLCSFVLELALHPSLYRSSPSLVCSLIQSVPVFLGCMAILLLQHWNLKKRMSCDHKWNNQKCFIHFRWVRGIEIDVKVCPQNSENFNRSIIPYGKSVFW